MSLLSVVVPAFNSGDRITRCIESVIQQTYKNWELIVVDDGSTDNTAEIVRDYADRDNRIKLIQQDNSGAGQARNTGILAAVGDYIVFVDSDDYLDASYFETIQPYMPRADVIFIDVLQVDEDGNVLSAEFMSDKKNLSKDELIRFHMTGKLLWGGVRRVCKRSLLLDNNVLFSEFKIGEENVFTFKQLRSANLFAFAEGAPAYYYVNREGSQSKQYDLDPYGRVFSRLLTEIRSSGLYDEYADTLNAFNVVAAIVSLDRMAAHLTPSEFFKMSKTRIAEYRKNIDSRFPIDYSSMPKKAKAAFIFLRYGVRVPFYVAGVVRHRLG